LLNKTAPDNIGQKKKKKRKIPNKSNPGNKQRSNIMRFYWFSPIAGLIVVKPEKQKKNKINQSQVSKEIGSA
jgi:hypothetical protein